MKLSHIINEAKYPADIDGITMKFLYLGINNAAKKILDNIKKEQDLMLILFLYKL